MGIRPEAAQPGVPARVTTLFPVIPKWMPLTQASTRRVQDSNELLRSQSAHHSGHQVFGPPAVKLNVAQLCGQHSNPVGTQDTPPRTPPRTCPAAWCPEAPDSRHLKKTSSQGACLCFCQAAQASRAHMDTQ